MATKYAIDAQRLKDVKTHDQYAYERMATDGGIWKDTYVTDGSEAAGDIIRLSREIPAGAFLIPAMSVVRTYSATGNLTVDIGIGDEVDNISDGQNIGGSGSTTPNGKEVNIEVAGQPYATVRTATSITAGVEIDFYFQIRQTS